MATISLHPPDLHHTEASARSDLGRRRRIPVVRLLRYAGVSVVATTTSLLVLFVLVGLVGVPAVWSNVVATAVGTVPSFELNRRWVWARRDRRSLLGQVVPFAALSFAGLLVSTATVGLVSGHTAGWGHWAHTLAVELANVAAFGSLWVVQYVLLDRYLFRGHTGGPGPAPEGALDFTAGRQTVPSSVGMVHPMLEAGHLAPPPPTRGGNDHARTR